MCGQAGAFYHDTTLALLQKIVLRIQVDLTLGVLSTPSYVLGRATVSGKSSLWLCGAFSPNIAQVIFAQTRFGCNRCVLLRSFVESIEIVTHFCYRLQHGDTSRGVALPSRVTILSRSRSWSWSWSWSVY
jgi:hypothetical protein